jgi:hypothetical protein
MLPYCADFKGLCFKPHLSLWLYTGAIEHLADSYPKSVQERAQPPQILSLCSTFRFKHYLAAVCNVEVDSSPRLWSVSCT